METPLTAPCVYCGSDRPIEAELCPTCGRGWIDSRIEAQPQRERAEVAGEAAGADVVAGGEGTSSVAAGSAEAGSPEDGEPVDQAGDEDTPLSGEEVAEALSAEPPDASEHPEQLGFPDEEAEVDQLGELDGSPSAEPAGAATGPITGAAAAAAGAAGAGAAGAAAGAAGAGAAGAAAGAGAARAGAAGAAARGGIPRVAGDEPPDMEPEPVDFIDVYGDGYADEALPVDEAEAITGAVVGATRPLREEPPAGEQAAEPVAAPGAPPHDAAEGAEAAAPGEPEEPTAPEEPESAAGAAVAQELVGAPPGEDDLDAATTTAEAEGSSEDVPAPPTAGSEDESEVATGTPAPEHDTAGERGAAGEDDTAGEEPDSDLAAADAGAGVTSEPDEVRRRPMDEPREDVSKEAAAIIAAMNDTTAAAEAESGFETTAGRAAAAVPGAASDEGDAIADGLSPLPMEEPRGRKVQTLVVLGVVAAVIVGWFFVLALISRGGDVDTEAQPPPATLPTESVPATAPPEAPTTAAEAPTTTAAVTTTGAETTTSAAPPTVPQLDAVGEPLAAADLGLGGFALGPFGFGSSEALGRLVATYGQPDGFVELSTEWGTCAEDQGFVTTWGPLSTIFLGSTDASELAGYRLGTDGDHPAADLRTLSGLQVGDTVAELESIYRRFSVHLQEVDGEPSFIVTRDTDGATLLWGPVTSTDDDGVVEGIFSPRPCDQGPVPAP